MSSQPTNPPPPPPPQPPQYPAPAQNPTAARVLMVAGVLFALTPWASIQVALGLGIALALISLTTWAKQAKAISRVLIQVSIVLLGFWINLDQVARAGLLGAAFSAGVIVLTFSVGALLGRLLRTDTKLTALLSSGTAICGGSAIAATGATIKASDTQMSVAFALVFGLNTVALYAFPPLGHAMGLSQQQFGAWAAVAIHDVANLVATAKLYGPESMNEAIVIKLTRVLWLAPICLVLGWWFAKREPAAGTDKPKPKSTLARAFTVVPWFVMGFLAASALRSGLEKLFPAQNFAEIADELRGVAKVLLTVALFLIGCGLSRKAIVGVGLRPFLHGTILWIIVSAIALVVVRATVV